MLTVFSQSSNISSNVSYCINVKLFDGYKPAIHLQKRPSIMEYSYRHMKTPDYIPPNLLYRYLDSSFTENAGQETKETRLMVNTARLQTAGRAWEGHEPIMSTLLLMIIR